jgi:L-threonylcarbamoyladenylate synthase
MSAHYCTVDEAIKLLQEGGIVGLPTETVYGLGADATNEEAVAKVFEAKNRPSFDPLIVHVATLADAEKVAVLNDQARSLFLAFSPGPLTLVLPKRDCIPDLVTSGHPTVAVRIPRHPLMLEVLRKGGLMVAAPSANPFGFTSPTTAQHVMEQLGEQIPAILDGGPAAVGLESTIVDLSGEVPKVLRLGGMAYEQLELVLGKIPIQLSSSKPNAPGMLISHYNPGKKVVLHPTNDAVIEALETDSLSWGLLYGAHASHHRALNLSNEGRLTEAAQNLFGFLRRLGKEQCSAIHVVKFEEYGLGRAINDRLQRAASKANER